MNSLGARRDSDGAEKEQREFGLYGCGRITKRRPGEFIGEKRKMTARPSDIPTLGGGRGGAARVIIIINR
jgi:hypothetical protein